MKIVFYDSYCGLCHFAIKSLVKLDVLHQLKFAPLYGETYYKFVPNEFHHLDTVIFWDNQNLYIKSDAIIRATLWARPSLFMLKIILILPKVIRDSIYDLIAKNRIRKSSCYIFPDRFDQFLP